MLSLNIYTREYRKLINSFVFLSVMKFNDWFDWYGTGAVIIIGSIIGYAFWDFWLSTIMLWIFIVLVLWIHH